MTWEPVTFSGAVGSAEQFDLATHTVLDGLQLWLCKVPEPNGVRGLLEHRLDGESGLFLQEGCNIDLGDTQLDDLLDILIYCAGGAVHDKRDGRHGLVQLAAERDVEMGRLDGHGVDLSLIHISEPTRLGMISYAVFCLKKKKQENKQK